MIHVLFQLTVTLQKMVKLDFVTVTLVMRMKQIVILIMNVKRVCNVDQTIVQLHLLLILKLIVVMLLYLEMKNFVLFCLVDKMKEIVISILSVKMV